MALPINGDNTPFSACFFCFRQSVTWGRCCHSHVHFVSHIIEFPSLLMPLCVIKIQRMSNRKRHLSAQVPWEQCRCAGISLHPYKPSAKYKKLSIAVLLLIHKPEAHQTQSQCWVILVGCLPEEPSWNGSSNSDSCLLKDNNNLKHHYYFLTHHLACFLNEKCSSVLLPWLRFLFLTNVSYLSFRTHSIM